MVRSCGSDSAISFVNLENLDVVGVVTIKCGSGVQLRDMTVGGEGLPVLRLLVENILHFIILRHIIARLVANVSQSLPIGRVGGTSLVDDIALLRRFLVKDLDLALRSEISTDNNTFSARIGQNLGS